MWSNFESWLYSAEKLSSLYCGQLRLFKCSPFSLVSAEVNGCP